MIHEIILENFMSYRYSRIPLKPGLNLVCGPNGAGKSSILLGLSVALGQTYTERSRKLSDLIRRGEEIGRVSVVFDNLPFEGKRPIPSIDSDTIVLSRYMKRNGDYWHEVNSRATMKGEVLRLLERLSIDPDNMLIIMHQNMIDMFGAIDARERLRLLEEAVGLRDYRGRIIEAREKLSHTLSEEESINSLLEKAQETLRYWEGEYGRFKRKRELEELKRELELEYAWAKCIRQEAMVHDLESRLEEIKRELMGLRQEYEQSSTNGEGLELRLKQLEFEIDASYQRLIAHERELAEAEERGKLIRSFSQSLARAGLDELIQQFEIELARAEEKLNEGDKRSKAVRSEIVEIKEEFKQTQHRWMNSRIHTALLEFRLDLLERDRFATQSELGGSKRELEQFEEEAKRVGGRVETQRRPREVIGDIKLTDAQIESLADVSPEIEQMYLSYQSTLKELRAKAEIAAANRKRALEEVELRQKRWRKELDKVLSDVRSTYSEILERVDAEGDVKLVNAHDIEEAGLELFVGFKGAEPQVLDVYTQSGGERTTAVMCFLLALQQRIRSPIRAIDEFEIHMDPHNRELILREILGYMKGEATQTLVITPMRLIEVEEVPNVITVQNAAGLSQVKVT
jgi:chromosome segregation ATPase